MSATTPDHWQPPLWTNTRQLQRVAFFLGAVVLAVTGLFVEFERRAILKECLSRTALYARLLEQQVTAMLNNSDTGLRSVGDTIEKLLTDTRPAGPSGRIDNLLSDAFRGRPLVRSTSVLTQQGQVLASSSTGNTGSALDMKMFGALPLSGQDLLIGPLLIGRDLSSLSVPKADAMTSPVLPLLSARTLPGGQVVYLVQILNLDYLGAQFDLTLASDTMSAGLSTYGGTALTGSENLVLTPGRSLSALAVFSQYLPRIESESYVGRGMNQVESAIAFRTLRKWPLVVMVQTPQSELNDLLGQVALQASALAGLMLALLAGSAMLVIRRQARHEALLLDFQKSNRQAAASDARNHSVLTSALDGILTIDSSGVIVAFNPAAERIFGHLASRAIGQSMASLIIPAHHRSEHTAGMARYLKTGNSSILNKRIEVEALHADGYVFPIELSIVPVQSNDEQFFTATTRNITEKKLVESERASLLHALSQLNQDLETERRALNEHAIVSISDANGIITHANDRLLATSGFTRDELVGKNYRRFWEETLTERTAQEFRSCIDRQKVWHGETFHPRKDGSRYWAASSVVPVFDAAGKLQKLVTVQTDISARRKAEIALGRVRESELEIGKHIQQALLVTPSTQPHAGLWLSSFNQASRGIDGDFLDFIKVGPDAIDIIVGDVMGKGTPAALMGAAVKLQFSRSIAELLLRQNANAGHPQPEDIVTAVNAAMAPHLQALNAFVTLVYLRIDLKANTVIWVGCGHEEPLLVDTRDRDRLLENQHPPIGLFLNEQYRQSELALLEGDALFLCSDGAGDAVLDNGERIGRDRVNSAVAQHVHAHQDPAMVLHAVRRDLLLDGVTINDDLTMLMLSRKRLSRKQARAELPVALTSLGLVRDFVEKQALETGLTAETTGLLTVAVVEVVTNIIRHAEGLVCGAPIALVIEEQEGSVAIELMYLGERYDPPNEVRESDFAAFPEGGFGLYIIQTVSIHTDYLHHRGVNTVRMMVLKPPEASPSGLPVYSVEPIAVAVDR